MDKDGEFLMMQEIERISSFIEQTVEQHDFDGALIGISGGIDSAVAGAIAVKALGPDRVKGLLLPERDSARVTRSDSKLVCRHLGISRRTRTISGALRRLGVYRLEPPALFAPRRLQERYAARRMNEDAQTDAFLEDLAGRGGRRLREGMAYYRIKHRLRMSLLYFQAEQENLAVLGTTNRSEWLTGFYVKWGDDSSDIEPLLHLYKSEIFNLAELLEIPESIRSKAPSPDLVPGLTDEAAMQISYQKLDRILIAKESGDAPPVDASAEEIDRVDRILSAAKKRSLRNLSLSRPGSQ
ncbi:MAG: NAD(+) synthase [Spirochaetales bacterium]|nr:NAD(+) synthase [Spirochaetales bacterium]MCF7937817.1 NAD(+) synthase [Spirochaetales bacterium]